MSELEMRQIGYDLFLPKPVSKTTLLASIKRLSGLVASRQKASGAEAGSATAVLPGLAPRPGPLVVSINPVFSHLLPKLLEAFGDMEQTIRQAVEKGDKALASRETHSLKGAALNFGVTPVASLAREIENAVKQDDRPGALASLDALGAVLPRLVLICGEK
jgi:HPt (histidine-containing phosphotransfer) domain-containing protein